MRSTRRLIGADSTRATSVAAVVTLPVPTDVTVSPWPRRNPAKALAAWRAGSPTRDEAPGFTRPPSTTRAVTGAATPAAG